jgi:hypothetical protein
MHGYVQVNIMVDAKLPFLSHVYRIWGDFLAALIEKGDDKTADWNFGKGPRCKTCQAYHKLAVQEELLWAYRLARTDRERAVVMGRVPARYSHAC